MDASAHEEKEQQFMCTAGAREKACRTKSKIKNKKNNSCARQGRERRPAGHILKKSVPWQMYCIKAYEEDFSECRPAGQSQEFYFYCIVSCAVRCFHSWLQAPAPAASCRPMLPLPAPRRLCVCVHVHVCPWGSSTFRRACKWTYV